MAKKVTGVSGRVRACIKKKTSIGNGRFSKRNKANQKRLGIKKYRGQGR